MSYPFEASSKLWPLCGFSPTLLKVCKHIICGRTLNFAMQIMPWLPWTFAYCLLSNRKWEEHPVTKIKEYILLIQETEQNIARNFIVHASIMRNHVNSMLLWHFWHLKYKNSFYQQIGFGGKFIFICKESSMSILCFSSGENLPQSIFFSISLICASCYICLTK